MGSRIIRNRDMDTARVYEAAERWVERALKSDDSLFTPGSAIWSSQWLAELRLRLLREKDASKNSFQAQLRHMLEESSPETFQLAAEALYFYFLFVSTRDGSNELNQIRNVLAWSPMPVEISQELATALDGGIGGVGTFYNTSRHFQIGFLVEFVEQWKELNPELQKRLLADPWAFSKFANQISFRSDWLRKSPNSTRPMLSALLHLVFPDTFEAIVSNNDKESITKQFESLVKEPSQDVNRQLYQIRPVLEEKYGSKDHLFYHEPVKSQWDENSQKYDTDESDKLDSPAPEPDPSPGPWSFSNLAKLAEKLLWPLESLQEIVDDLQGKRQVIFYGPPGTGKTYVAQAIAEQCKLHGGDFDIVQFHPSYSYEDFVEGFRPTLTDNGQAGFKLTRGPLRRIAEKARNNHNATYILIIDELNRGNVAKVFGELYFLLEYRDKEVRLQYGGDESEGFSLPPNLWFICTMNTADRSIALMDAALRRRFYFASFFPNKAPIRGLLRRWLASQGQDTWVSDLVDKANAELERDSAIGPSYFMAEEHPLDDNRVRRIWQRAVLPYLEEQCFGETEKLKALDYDKLKGRLTADTSVDTAPEQGDSEQAGSDAADT